MYSAPTLPASIAWRRRSLRMTLSPVGPGCCGRPRPTRLRSRSFSPTSSPTSSAESSATRGRWTTRTATLSPARKYVEVDGKFADAVLGELSPRHGRFIVAVEGKGPKDPLDRPFAGRKMSAVDQGYRYAINLPCDWIIVTSMRQTRLYHKGSDQYTYERFDTDALAKDEAQLRRFVFLLGPKRVVPATGPCHLYELLNASEKVGRELTKEFYVRYADMREDAFDHLCRANPTVGPHEVLASTQKLLDRILFCAFCEDRGLLPPETIQKAYAHNDPYNPRPIWENFRGLFRAINIGNTALNIPAYNGGLFADDPDLDRLAVPDEVCRYFQDLATYDYRPPHEAADEPISYRHQAGRRRYPRPYLRAVDHRPGTAPQRAGRPHRAARPDRARQPPQEGRGVLHARFHHPLHRQPGARQRPRTTASRRSAASTPRRPSGTARRVLSRPARLRPQSAQRPPAGRPHPLLGCLAGRARDHQAARPLLRQRRVPDRGIRAALQRLPAVE